VRGGRCRDGGGFLRHLQFAVSGWGSGRFFRNSIRFVFFIGLLVFPFLTGVSMVNRCRSICSFWHGQFIIADFTFPAPFLLCILEGPIGFFLFRLTRCTNGFCLRQKAREESGKKGEAIATFVPVLGDGNGKSANDGPSVSSNCEGFHQSNRTACKRNYQP